MKKILLILIFLLSTSSYAKIYKVVVHKDWKPYYFIDKNNKPTGYAVELFSAVAKKANIKFEYIIVDNWKDGQILVNQGKADVIPNLGITQQRSTTYLFTQPTDTFSVALFKRKKSFNINSIEAIKNRTIGVVEGNICNRVITDKTTTTIYKYKKFTRALHSLLSGEIDIFCYPKPLLEFKLKELNLEDKIISFGLPITELKRGIGISHNNFELLTMFDEALSSLKIEGKYQEIYAKWFLPKKLIKLTQKEMVFIGFGVFIFFISLLFFIFYFSNKKKWLLTNQDLQEEVNKKTKDLIKLSTTDSLTQIYNRNKLDEIILREINISQRTFASFFIVMIDIDFFKEVNDTFGHLIGDQVLVEFSEIIKRNIREIDYFGRWGGEEFLLISPFTKNEEAILIINRIKEAIHRHVFPKGIQKTASFGITKYKKNDTTFTLIQRADDALYEAKERGRNKIVEKY